MAAFVIVLITSNIIGPAKISQIDMPVIGTITFGAGVIFSHYRLSFAISLRRFTDILRLEELFGLALLVLALLHLWHGL